MRSLLAIRRLSLVGGLVFTLAAAGAASAAAPCAPSPYPAPYAGPTNHAHTATPFRWGWFGAEHYYPQVGWHRDYNGDLMRWSTWRRY